MTLISMHCILPVSDAKLGIRGVVVCGGGAG